MSKPLFDAVMAHKNMGDVSFHTPGHKGNAWELDELFSSKCDLTELCYTDELFMPTGVIAEAEGKATNFFKSKATLFSAGGCSLCIQAMLRIVCKKEGAKIIAGRNIHRSAVNAMMLLNIKPVWIVAKQQKDEPFLPGRITAQDVRTALEKHRDADAVYITTPDYYGCISDVSGISSVCHEFGVPLLVDRAHGAHLPFISETSQIISGADMYADSAHKTMPVFTGGAFLNIYNETYIKQAKNAMALFASTSPSYPVMCSLDFAREWLEDNGINAWESTALKVKSLKEVAKDKGFTVPNGICDPTRLTIGTAKLGLDGTKLAKYFESKRIFPEYSDKAHVVFIITPFNTNNELELLRSEIFNLDVKQNSFTPKNNEFILPKEACSLREALFAEKERINTENSVGKIVGEILCPCPPGVPVVMPGEIISNHAVFTLLEYGITEVEVVYGM